MGRVTRLALFAGLTSSVFVLTACSGSSGKPAASSPAAAASGPAANARLSSDQLVAALKAALGSSTVTALQINGLVNDRGTPTPVHLQLNGDTAAGTVDSPTAGPLSIITTQGVTYVHVTSRLLADYNSSPHQAGQGTTSAPLDSWVPSSSDTGTMMGAYYSDLGSLSDFLQTWEATADTYTYDGTGTVRGMAVAFYKDVDGSDSSGWTGVLAVPANGPVLPIQEVASASGVPTTTTSFVWNKPTATIVAPPPDEMYWGI